MNISFWPSMMYSEVGVGTLDTFEDQSERFYKYKY